MEVHFGVIGKCNLYLPFLFIDAKLRIDAAN